MASAINAARGGEAHEKSARWATRTLVVNALAGHATQPARTRSGSGRQRVHLGLHMREASLTCVYAAPSDQTSRATEMTANASVRSLVGLNAPLARAGTRVPC